MSVESEPLSEESETVSEDASVLRKSLSNIVVGNVTIPTEQIRSAYRSNPVFN